MTITLTQSDLSWLAPENRTIKALNGAVEYFREWDKEHPLEQSKDILFYASQQPDGISLSFFIKILPLLDSPNQEFNFVIV